MDRVLHGHWLAPSNSIKDSDVVRIIEREGGTSLEPRHLYRRQEPTVGTGAAELTGFTGVTVTTVGSRTNPGDVDGYYINYSTGTLISALGGWHTLGAAPEVTQLRHAATAALDFLWVVKTGTVASDLSPVRLFFGLTASTGAAALSHSTASIRFNYNTVERADTTWRAVTSSGTPGSGIEATAAEFKDTDTEIPVTLDTRYELRLRILASDHVEFWIDGTPVAAHLAAPMPSTTAGLKIEAFVMNGAAGTTRNLKQRHFVGLVP